MKRAVIGLVALLFVFVSGVAHAELSGTQWQANSGSAQIGFYEGLFFNGQLVDGFYLETEGAFIVLQTPSLLFNTLRAKVGTYSIRQGALSAVTIAWVSGLPVVLPNWYSLRTTKWDPYN